MDNPLLEPWTPTQLARFRRRLLRWFQGAARDLPWRRTDNPYHIWVSEIMLQQTTVKAVVPFFERFMQRFPTVGQLAEATEEEVLRLWEGLGYYSRGRNLRRGAQWICEQHGGTVPGTVAELLAVPGIGRYTAGAIVSFGFNQPAPILEANTVRLYSRLLGYQQDPRSAAGQRLLWEFASCLPSREQAASINQALMELGSLVCRPQAPGCPECPVHPLCAARQQGLEGTIPVPAKRPEITELVEGCVVVQQQGRWLLRRRRPEERWGGLWDFPRCGLTDLDYSGRLSQRCLRMAEQQLQEYLYNQFRVKIEFQDGHHQLRHAVTRYRIRLLVFVADVTQSVEDTTHLDWLDPTTISDIPLSVTARKIADWMLAR